ncbi:MAG: hypothetical protein AABZ53_16520 [Planctomycetota bacterium]
MTTLRDLLLPGLTGCIGGHGSIHRQALPSPVVGAWRHACRLGIGRLRVKITEEVPATTGQNYHLVGALAPPPVGRVQVALHVIHPFIGAWRFTTECGGQDGREYWDPPLNPAELPEGLVLIPAELLSRRFEPEAWMRDLIEDAWTDIRVHKPRTVGELVFNWYD